MLAKMQIERQECEREGDTDAGDASNGEKSRRCYSHYPQPTHEKNGPFSILNTPLNSNKVVMVAVANTLCRGIAARDCRFVDFLSNKTRSTTSREYFHIAPAALKVIESLENCSEYETF